MPSFFPVVHNDETEQPEAAKQRGQADVQPGERWLESEYHVMITGREPYAAHHGIAAQKLRRLAIDRDPPVR